MSKSKIFYGYWVLLSCFLFCLISVGSGINTFGIFISHLQNALGTDRAEIMGALTFYILIAGIMGPLAGRLVDNYGAQKIITAGSLVIVTGFVILSQTNSLLTLYLGYLMLGTGTTFTGPVVSSNVVSQWFKKRRGMAIGIMSMGMSMSGVIFAPFVAILLIPHFGWREAYLTIAAINFVIVIPLSMFVVRTKPSEMSLLPDGVEVSLSTDRSFSETVSSKVWPLKSVLATSAFWLLGLSLFLNHSHMGIHISIFPHLRDMNLPLNIAASAISTLSLMSFCGMFFFGWLCDKIRAKYAAVIGLSLIATGILIFMAIGYDSPVGLVWLFAGFMGFGVGSWLPTMSMLTSDTFGLASYGTIFGVLSMFQNAGAATGPLVAGYIYDVTNTYRLAGIIILAMVVLAMPLVMAVKRQDNISI